MFIGSYLVLCVQGSAAIAQNKIMEQLTTDSQAPATVNGI
jgi:hypothetical protein